MNTKQSFLQELLIVIVIFEKNPSETTAFQSLNSIRKEATLFLYDNSAAPHQFLEINNTIYLHDGSNPGVSKAYNEACKIAKTTNKKWLMMADQDTDFPGSFFEKYQLAINTFPDSKIFTPFLIDHVGLVSPFVFRHGKGSRISGVQPGVKDLAKFRFANSGLVVALIAFEDVGGYDERFPLDYSDIVFGDKLSKHYSNFILVDIQSGHHFSGSERNQEQNFIDRFSMFCKAVLLYKKISSMNVPLYWVLLPRAIKLSLQSRNVQFLKLAWSALLKG